MKNNPIRILIADDHSLIRMGLVSFLADRKEFEIIAQAEDGERAIALARQLKPDIILMDINMPVVSGLEATKVIKSEDPAIKIIMLTVSSDDQDLFEAVRSGASGYLVKNVITEQLIEALIQVSNGEVVIPQVFMGRILQEFAKKEIPAGSHQEPLSPRELEVLTLVADGLSNKEIGEALSLSEYNVKIHLSNILAKLHLNNRVQAAAYAIRKGLAK